jgi:hypothetical protein
MVLRAKVVELRTKPNGMVWEKIKVLIKSKLENKKDFFIGTIIIFMSFKPL